MIYRLLRWLGWIRPPEQPVPNKRSELRRLQNSSARSNVDQNRRSRRGGTGTGNDRVKKDKPPVKPDDSSAT